ncbi:hypothetical protein [Lentilactobacillus buchneri]|nr:MULTISPECIES: hypothetical protein [Lentilactobacillus]MCV3743239.1 hypothetical protein [Lentilactobacillus hilgardii]
MKTPSRFGPRIGNIFPEFSPDSKKLLGCRPSDKRRTVSWHK